MPWIVFVQILIILVVLYLLVASLLSRHFEKKAEAHRQVLFDQKFTEMNPGKFRFQNNATE